jgi:hypothetical protein
VQDSVAHSQMKGTFSTSSYSLAAFAIFSFASLNVESLRAIRSSLDCMPQLIHLRRQEKTFVPEARLAHAPWLERGRAGSMIKLEVACPLARESLPELPSETREALRGPTKPSVK